MKTTVFRGDELVVSLHRTGGVMPIPTMAIEEGELIRRILGGQRDLFADLIAPHLTPLLRALRATVGGYVELEDIVQPLVQEAEQQLLTDAERRGEKVAVLDIPLLFETGGDRRVDAVVVVSAPPEVQQARLLERPGMTIEKLESILGRQMPDAEKRARADFIVDTSRGYDAARAQVRAILDAVVTMPRRRI